MIENKVGARTHPCFTPVWTTNISPISPSTKTADAMHAIRKKPDHGDQDLRASKLLKNQPQSRSVNRVKCFGQVNETCIQVFIFLSAFLLDLTCCKDHIHCSSLWAKATVRFW